jgi:hypothetical protein
MPFFHSPGEIQTDGEETIGTTSWLSRSVSTISGRQNVSFQLISTPAKITAESKLRGCLVAVAHVLTRFWRCAFQPFPQVLLIPHNDELPGFWIESSLNTHKFFRNLTVRAWERISMLS